MFQKIHESFDEIDSEKMYPFYLEKETSFAEDSGERNVRHPYPILNLFLRCGKLLLLNCRKFTLT